MFAQDDDFEISEEEAAAILDGPNGTVADDDLTAVMEDLTIGGEDKADMVAPAEEQVWQTILGDNFNRSRCIS